jgi:hypothetical protein
MKQWNRAFWILFIITAALVVAAMIVRILYLDIMLGFLVVSIGIIKLSEEFSSREITHSHDDIRDNIRYLSHQVDASHLFSRRVKEKHEHRFLKLDNKRNDIDEKIENNYDSLAKKIIQNENRLNDVTKAVVVVAKSNENFTKSFAKDAQNIRNAHKEIQNSVSKSLKKIDGETRGMKRSLDGGLKKIDKIKTISKNLNDLKSISTKERRRVDIVHKKAEQLSKNMDKLREKPLKTTKAKK